MVMSLTPPNENSKIAILLCSTILVYVNIHVETSTNVILLLEAQMYLIPFSGSVDCMQNSISFIQNRFYWISQLDWIRLGCQPIIILFLLGC